MKTVNVKVTQVIEMTYDPDSQDFRDSLDSYKSTVDTDGTESTMLEHAAHHIARFGLHSMVEGVGYVREGRTNAHSRPFSGITIDAEYDHLETEVL